MEERRLRFMSKKKAQAKLKRLKAGSNQRSFDKIQLNLLCRDFSRKSR